MKRVMKRGLAMLLTLLMMVGVVGVGGTLEAEAISQNEAVAWAKAQGDNRTAFDLNGDYGNGGYQCSDFVSAYMNYLMDGNPRSGRYNVYNANYYDTVASWDPTHWEVIQNYAAFLPQPGDIFVSEYGTYGHVGVVISSNTSTAVIVDQNTDSNWNYYTGSPCWTHTITWKSNNTGIYGANWFIRFKGFNNDTTPPTISNVKVSNVTMTGYTVTCTVSDNVGVTRVAFPTWTINNGQDDLLWKDGTISGNTATFQVRISDHGNEIGNYVTHIYAYDAAGNAANDGTPYVYVGDSTKPVLTLSPSNAVERYQTIDYVMTDNVGVAGLYYGSHANYKENGFSKVLSPGTRKEGTLYVYEPHTLYITAIDDAGNVSDTYSFTFYRTTLNANGGSVSPASVLTVSGKAFALPAPTRTGYTIKNWNTKSDGTGTSYSAGASYKPTGSVTLYAQWTPITYTVKYNANGGSNPPANQTKTYGKTLTLTSLTPTRAGYKFTGWNTKANGTGTAYAPASNYTANAALTLYAQWAIDVQSVAIDTAPAQTVYHIGDELNPAGLRLTGTDSAGNTVTITEGFTCTPAVLTERGEQTVTVTYQDKTATFTVRVIGDPDITIRRYVSSRTEDYKTTMIFTAIPLDPPEGATVQWYVDGRKQGTGETFTVEEATSDYTVQCRLVGADGSVIAESKTETVRIKTNLWARIVAFFRSIFKRLPVIVQTIKETL